VILIAAREWLERALSTARTRAQVRDLGGRICAIAELQDFQEHYELRQPMAEDTKTTTVRQEPPFYAISNSDYCPKCRFQTPPDGPRVRYMEASEELISTDRIVVPEALRISCVRCGYGFTVPCADAEETPRG
jgi:hypothetical protein